MLLPYYWGKRWTLSPTVVLDSHVKVKDPKVEDIGLLSFGNAAPWTLPSVQVEVSTVTKIDRVSVRVLVPSHYRSLFLIPFMNPSLLS